jgi:G3E family GTPase
MKTIVVCGVLGSGKTSFIRNVLKGASEKTVVLVNDFGSAGIDGEIISAGGIETVELPSGCVCCSLRFDLIRTLQQITEQFQPECLYIEPSGVAAPSGVLEVLDTLKIGNVSVVGIVDATDFIDSYEQDMYGWFFENQVVRSDIVLVNKTDLVDRDRREQTVRLVEKLNPGALVIPAVHAIVDAGVIHTHKGGSRQGIRHEHSLKFQTLTVTFRDVVSRVFLEGEMGKLAAGHYGKVVRAKALVETEQGPCRFDLSSGRVDAEPFHHPVKESRLVIIGTDLLEDKISSIAG